MFRWWEQCSTPTICKICQPLPVVEDTGASPGLPASSFAACVRLTSISTTLAIMLNTLSLWRSGLTDLVLASGEGCARGRTAGRDAAVRAS